MKPSQLGAFVVSLAATTALASAARAATITVTSNSDNTTSGNCTLREAIAALNSGVAIDQCAAGGTSSNTIELPSGTITVSNTGAQMSINRHVTFNGKGYNQTIIDFSSGKGLDIGTVAASSPSVTFRSLTLYNTNQTMLRVGSSAYVTVNYAKLNHGWALGDPGCISVGSSATVMIADAELTSCSGIQGGLVNNGTLTLWRSGVRGSNGSWAGAIANFGNLYVNDSTIANNYSGESGGAIYNGAGTTTIVGSTIVYNDSDHFGTACTNANASCGAVHIVPGSTIKVKSSVISMNTSVNQTNNKDCSGTDPTPSGTGPYNINITSDGYNLLGHAASNGCPRTATDLQGQDPKLIVGASNAPIWRGGVALGYLPQTTSPLLNYIPTGNDVCHWANPDQRGVRRGKGGGCEPGSVERSTALFVVENPASLNAGDAATKTKIEELGFAVSLADDNTVVPATASGIHIVVISESVTSTNIGTKLQTIPSGVLVMEPSLYDDMKMTLGTENSHFGSSTGQASVRLQGFGDGRVLGINGTNQLDVTLVTSAQTFGWGKPGGGGFVHASMTNDTSRAAYFDYWAGATLADGTTAAGGHRVGFFAFPGTVTALSGSGASGGHGLMSQAILRAAIE